MIALTILGIPAGIWLLLYMVFPKKSMGGSIQWEFDVNSVQNSFLFVADRYRGTSGMMFWVAAGLLLASLYLKNESAIAMFSACLVAVMFFQGYMLLCYEGYCHRKYSTASRVFVGGGYTTGKYALVQALGFSAIVYFILGLVALNS